MKVNQDALRQELRTALEQTEKTGVPDPERYESISRILDEELRAHEESLPPPTQIAARHVRLLVTDEASGRLYVRTLPIEYFENHNGITLVGENISAEEVRMVFLSADALARLGDLQGSGADKPRCHD